MEHDETPSSAALNTICWSFDDPDTAMGAELIQSGYADAQTALTLWVIRNGVLSPDISSAKSTILSYQAM